MFKKIRYSFVNISSLRHSQELRGNRQIASCNDQTAYKGADDGSKSDGFFSSLTKRGKSVSKNKISVIGTGHVGMVCAVSCLTYGLTSELCLYDIDKKKTKGEAMDLQHGSLFLKGPRITAAYDLEETSKSQLIIVTSGARQMPGETRPALVGRNVEIFCSIIPELAKSSPDAIFLIVSNPVDTMTYVAWKLSKFPVNRVVGSGTNLDSSRFRYLIATKMRINVKHAHGYIVGEHGDTSVPVWSGVNIAGVPLRSCLPSAGNDNDPEKWNELHKTTVNGAYDVISMKGYTSWAVGFSVGQLSEAMLQNTLSIHPVSTNLNGMYGIEDDVFASVPCILGESGVLATVKLPLTPYEEELFHKSIDAIRQIICTIDV